MARFRPWPIYPELHDEEWLRERVEAGRTVAEIASELRCAGGTVRIALQRAGLFVPVKPKRRHPLLSDREWLVARLAEGMTPAKVAAEAGTNPATVNAWIRRHDLRPSPGRKE